MIYLKSILAGIAGSILVVIMFVIALIVLNTTGFFKPDGMVGISVFSPMMLAITAQKIPDPRRIVAGRIGFSARWIGAFIVRNNMPDVMARHDRLQKAAKRLDLACWKRIDSIVTIHQFDAD
jgi:uncharacterized membrane protein